MASKNSRVSEAVIRRLPIYHRFLTDLINKGIERTSSKDLSILTGFTASQIRQDLNNFGEFGQQGYGYNTTELRDEISNILGMNYTHNAILIGAGQLGSAIAKFKGFKESGFKIKALFDSNPAKIGMEINSLPIRDIKEMETFIKEHKIDVAIITIPKDHVTNLVNKLVECKIKGIWNFSPIDITVPSGVVIENVRLNDSLLKLSYYLKESRAK